MAVICNPRHSQFSFRTGYIKTTIQEFTKTFLICLYFNILGITNFCEFAQSSYICNYPSKINITFHQHRSPPYALHSFRTPPMSRGESAGYGFCFSLLPFSEILTPTSLVSASSPERLPPVPLVSLPLKSAGVFSASCRRPGIGYISPGRKQPQVSVPLCQQLPLLVFSRPGCVSRSLMPQHRCCVFGLVLYIIFSGQSGQES